MQTVKQFYSTLYNTDWFYEYIDNYNKFKAAQTQYNNVRRQAEQSPVFKRMWNDFENFRTLKTTRPVYTEEQFVDMQNEMNELNETVVATLFSYGRYYD